MRRRARPIPQAARAALALAPALVLALAAGEVPPPAGEAAEPVPPAAGADVVRRLALYVVDEAGDRVVCVNRDEERVFASIEVGRRPRGLEVSADGRAAYVASSGDDALTVLDTSTHRVADTVRLKPGCAPEDVAVALDGRRIAVACAGSSVLAVVDALTNAVLGEVALSRRPGRLATSPDGRRVYALVPEGNQVVAVDVLRLRDEPRVVAVEAEPTDLVVAPIDGRLFVSHARAPLVSVLDRDLGLERRLQVGRPAYGLAIERDGRRLHASGGDAGGVSTIDTRAATIVRRWNTERGYLLALDPDGRKLFVAGGASGELTVLDRIAGRSIAKIRVGGRIVDLAVVP